MVKVNDKRFCGIFLNSFKNDVGQFSEERPRICGSYIKYYF